MKTLLKKFFTIIESYLPGHHFAEIGLHAAELQGAGALQGFLQQGGDEVELHRQANAGLQRVHPRKAAFHRPATAAVEIAVDQHVFPRDQHMIHHETYDESYLKQRLQLAEKRQQKMSLLYDSLPPMNIQDIKYNLIYRRKIQENKEII